ncbi:hypothetical protein MPH_09468 [Macrophomina phaseolina MS6]|uniref:Uncharacterized protein n=1 Tax=Macrophomina phaseolina (strain MS6) TaxID=1126212 RepID=K2RKR9_MACPH|nr:hypothetical protein MPH_09468 [Macrophomina phaseolina MS6]
MSNEVLIHSDMFGLTDGSSLTWPVFLQIAYPYSSRTYRTYSNYAQQCYTNDTNRANCNIFVKPRLQATVDRNAPCPFDHKICRSADQNILLDTGLLDTHADLGANIRPDQRFFYRKKVHCAPLKTEGFKKEYPATEQPGIGFGITNWTKPAHTKYYYGNGVLEEGNITYEYNTKIPDPSWKEKTGSSYYTLGTIYPWSEFMPINPLRRVDADGLLVFLSANDIYYSAEVDDPWYSAHRPYAYSDMRPEAGRDLPQNTSNLMYYRDEPASVLGCAMQEQLCNPRLPEKSRCTPLSGGLDRNQNAARIVRNREESLALAWQLELLLSSVSLADILQTLGDDSLTSVYSLFRGTQPRLPSNQWQLDVERWHSIMLASLQGQAVAIAEGPVEPGLRAEMQKPRNKRERELCR